MIYKPDDWDIHNLDSLLNFGFVINSYKVYYFTREVVKFYEN
jgi:hypothetical protein